MSDSGSPTDPRPGPPPPPEPGWSSGIGPPASGSRADTRPSLIVVVATVIVALPVPIWLLGWMLVVVSYTPDEAPQAHLAFLIYPVVLWLSLRTTRRWHREHEPLAKTLLALVPAILAAAWFATAFISLATS